MNDQLNIKAYIELFHLLFMEQFNQKVNKRLYALKGGCNLRFYLGSIRYSEDIDIDIHTIALNTLKNTVNKILSSVPFTRILKAKNIVIVDTSTPKQTETTQRWKIQIKTPHQSLPVNTKLEFSRRTKTIQAVTSAVSRELTVTYQLRSIFMQHYDANAALQQKIKALILRKETQARDIFDIYHLLQTQKVEVSNKFTPDELQKAIENALAINFSEFKSQVISYLEPSYQSQYDNTDVWGTIVTTVYDTIASEIK